MPDWWIGRKHTPETIEKMRLSKLGAKNNFHGRSHTDQTKSAISISRSGKATGSGNANFGKPRDAETRKKISDTRVALGIAVKERNPNWQGGIANNRIAELSTTKYKNWRIAVFERDEYTCVHCGQVGGDLEADHIKQWTFYPELRYEIENGRTLCLKCHRKTFKAACALRDRKRK